MVASTKPVINPTPFADKFFRMVDEMPAVHFAAVRATLFHMGQQSSTTMVRRLTTGPRTGRRYRIFGRSHQASAAGEYPAKLTGKLARNADYSVRADNELEVGIRDFAGPDYPKFLEFGTRKMERRPFVEPTSDEFANETAVQLAEYSRVGLSKRLGRRFLP